MANDLLVRILGDSRSLERAFARSSKSASTFGKDMDRSSRKFASFGKGAAAGLGIGVGLSGAVRGIQGVVSEASNLNEQLSRTRQVFEESSASVVAWSTTTARSMGIAQSAALEAAGTFGAMFDQAGQSSAEAARLSETVVRLAADLASFNNTSVDDALIALRSGLSGEIEPLRRFQVFLTEAAVSQRAMADTGKDNVKQLTQGEKILARYALIMAQTTKQQGDFARTSGSLANQQRVLSAEWKNARAELGEGLLPVMIKLTEAGVGIVRSFHNATDASRLFSEQVRNDLADAFGVEFVRKALAKAGPELERAMREFEASIDPFNIIVPINLVPKFKTTVDPADFAKQPGVDFTLPRGAATVSPDVAARNREILAEARGNLKEALAIQVARREGLKRLLDAAIENGAKQSKINDLAERYARAQAAVIGTQGQIAANAAAAAAAAAATADAEADKAASDKKAAAARAAQLKQAALAAEQIRQFRALGLSATGGEIVPGVENLRKQLGQLSERLAGSDVQSKLVNRLAGVRKLLKGQFGQLTEETRAAINDLFRTIRGEFDKETREGPLTRTTSLNAGKILEGLGLGRDQEKELRARLSSFNSAGRAIGGAQTVATGGFRGGIATGIVVENHNTINLDGDTVARNVTKSQQSARRRNPTQKRGRRSGI